MRIDAYAGIIPPVGDYIRREREKRCKTPRGNMSKRYPGELTKDLLNEELQEGRVLSKPKSHSGYAKDLQVLGV